MTGLDDRERPEQLDRARERDDRRSTDWRSGDPDADSAWEREPRERTDQHEDHHGDADIHVNWERPEREPSDDRRSVDYSRPSHFRSGVRSEVWNDAIEPATGRVRDPVTGQFMSAEQPWDMGHRPGYEFRKHAANAEQRGISRQEFMDEYMNPDHYRPEKPSSNRSHKGEDHTDAFLG